MLLHQEQLVALDYVVTRFSTFYLASTRTRSRSRTLQTEQLSRHFIYKTTPSSGAARAVM